LFEGEDDDEYGGETSHQVEVQQEQQQVEEQAYQEPGYEQVVFGVEEFVYYDPVKKLKFSFDPITFEAKIEEKNVDWESSTLDPSTVQLR